MFYPGFLPHHLDRMTIREIGEYRIQMQTEIQRRNNAVK
jgi:hypothetical protein